MSLYRNILVALDLSKDSELLIKKAHLIAERNEAKLNLLHVIEPISFAYGGEVPIDISTVQKQLNDHAQTQLDLLAEGTGYPIDKKLITTGGREGEIKNIASELGADLVIVGSHDRHGLALILGSTVNGVIQGANCDVLAVKV
ncbi:MAG: universal stress protein [Pontibacterium sp.]